jgi:23S rRNA (cytosine1962-C5)-methyltransferase
MADVSAFENRLRKNLTRLTPLMARAGITAWRAYDQDIPEFRFTVDRYADHVMLTEYKRLGATAAQVEAVTECVVRLLKVPQDRLHRRVRQPHKWGQEQYGRLDQQSLRVEVSEGGLKFWVNLTDYLDVGLFMDHRRTRDMVRKESQGRRMVNLFAYTGAFSVYAAAGHARSTTSVDQSGVYLDWSEENLQLNALEGPQHTRVRADVLTWVRGQPPGVADLIVLDPPSYSEGGKMQGTFEVQRDHPALLADTLRLLAPGGLLYFSNNLTTFTLDDRALAGARSIRELTPASLPPDFRNAKVHRCWRVEK